MDYPQQSAGDRSNQSIIIDTGKYAAAMVLCAVVCGVCSGVTWWAVDRQREVSDRYHSDTVDWQNQHERERNHIIELEARLQIQGQEIQEMKHVRR